MDIQSSTFNELFVLYPVIIQGLVTPVKPDGVAHGGIPQALYDDQTQGLECLVDPWTELQLVSWTMAADDRVDLYVNDDPNPVTGKTVAPGEEQLRVRLYLAHGRLNQGVNRLHYKVTRVGGNVESSRDLLVLYHLRLPESLELVIPPDVLRDGVGPERAAQGVTLGFNYSNRRKYDVIACLIGDTTVRFDVPDAPAAINQTLFTDTFQRAGDNPSAVLEFRVFDQLGNVVKSGEKRLDIHLGRVTLLAPTVQGMNGNQFSPTIPEVRVLVPQGSLLPGDMLKVKWTGATAVAAGSYTSPPRLVSAGLEIAVPRSVLAYSLGQQVTVTYFIERDGNTTESPPLLLNILPLPATALIAPKIVEADANNYLDVLALGTKNATIHGLLHTLIEAGQQCWMRLEGKKADGSVHNLTVWSGSSSQVNATWINQGYWPKALTNSYLKDLGHNTPLTIKYKVALDKSNVEANAVVFPDRVYTIKAVELVVPTLNNVFDTAGNEVLEAGLTVSTTLKLRGTASKGLKIEIFDRNEPSAESKGIVTSDAETGIWEHTFAVTLGAHRFYAKALYLVNPVYSNARTLTITADVAPAITSVKELLSGNEIPEGGTTVETAVTLTGAAASGQKVNILNGLNVVDEAIADSKTGVWALEVLDLTATNHSFTAEAKYGLGQVSQPPRTFRVKEADVVISDFGRRGYYSNGETRDHGVATITYRVLSENPERAYDSTMLFMANGYIGQGGFGGHKLSLNFKGRSFHKVSLTIFSAKIYAEGGSENANVGHINFIDSQGTILTHQLATFATNIYTVNIPMPSGKSFTGFEFIQPASQRPYWLTTLHLHKLVCSNT